MTCPLSRLPRSPTIGYGRCGPLGCPEVTLSSAASGSPGWPRLLFALIATAWPPAGMVVAEVTPPADWTEGRRTRCPFAFLHVHAFAAPRVGLEPPGRSQTRSAKWKIELPKPSADGGAEPAARHHRRKGVAERRSDCLAECVRRSLQTVTDLGQFMRRKIDALLLYIRTCLLAGSCVEKALQLHRHVLDDVGEVGELTCDERYVRLLSHVWRILGRARVYVRSVRVASLSAATPSRSASPPSTAPGREPRGPGGRWPNGARWLCVQGSAR